MTPFGSVNHLLFRTQFSNIYLIRKIKNDKRKLARDRETTGDNLIRVV